MNTDIKQINSSHYDEISFLIVEMEKIGKIREQKYLDWSENREIVLLLISLVLIFVSVVLTFFLFKIFPSLKLEERNLIGSFLLFFLPFSYWIISSLSSPSIVPVQINSPEIEMVRRAITALKDPGFEKEIEDKIPKEEVVDDETFDEILEEIQDRLLARKQLLEKVRAGRKRRLKTKGYFFDNDTTNEN